MTVETQTPQDPAVDTPEPEKTPEQIKEEAATNPNVNIDAGDEPSTETTNEPDGSDVIDTKGVTKDKEPDKPAEKPAVGVWYENLGPDFKNDPDVTKYNSLEEYVKGNREVRKMVGKDKLVVPTENSTPEEVNTFYEKLGRPKEASGYKIPAVERPDGLPESEADIEAFRAEAHAMGLSDKQFSKLFEMQNRLTTNRYNQELKAASELKAKTETTLRAEYGAAYDAKVDAAQKVVNTFFARQNLHTAFNVLANDTGFVRAMANIAEKLGEDVIAGGVIHTLTPEQAQKEIESLVGGSHDMSKAFFDELHPEHQAAVDKNIALQRMASAGGG